MIICTHTIKIRVLSLHSKRFGELAWKRLKIREDQAGETEKLYITFLKDYFSLKINTVANVNGNRFRLSQAGDLFPKATILERFSSLDCRTNDYCSNTWRCYSTM